MWHYFTKVNGFEIYVVNLGFQAVCVLALCIVLASIRSLARSVGLAMQSPERVLGALEVAAGRLAEAIHEAEGLCSKLENLAYRSASAKSNLLTEGAKSGKEDGLSSASGGLTLEKADFDLSKPGIVPRRVREKFDAVRRLSDSGASLASISEQTGLSKSETRFVLGILGARGAQSLKREET